MWGARHTAGRGGAPWAQQRHAPPGTRALPAVAWPLSSAPTSKSSSSSLIPVTAFASAMGDGVAVVHLDEVAVVAVDVVVGVVAGVVADVLV